MLSVIEKMEETVTIHGKEWKIADIEEKVAWCRQHSWIRQRWKPTPALVQKKGRRTSQYLGQKFDSDKTELVEDGWSHDHCAICWWTLFESDQPDENTGWTDGYLTWLCCECYDQFVRSGPD